MNNEPVAFVSKEDLKDMETHLCDLHLKPQKNDIPLYTHPADLTDEEIWQITEDFWKRDWTTLDVGFARTILRKAQEK